MKTLRLVLAAFVAASFGSAALAADDKTDVKKLIVGKWEVAKADADTLPVGTKIEFTADGKLKVTGKDEGGKEQSFEGTYTVDGSSFTYKMKIGDMERSQKITVNKVSDTELDTTNPENKKVSFKKVK